MWIWKPLIEYHSQTTLTWQLSWISQLLQFSQWTDLCLSMETDGSNWIERAVVEQLPVFQDNSLILDPFWTSFHTGMGMETALAALMDDLWRYVEVIAIALLNRGHYHNQLWSYDPLPHWHRDSADCLTVPNLLSSWSRTKGGAQGQGISSLPSDMQLSQGAILSPVLFNIDMCPCCNLPSSGKQIPLLFFFGKVVSFDLFEGTPCYLKLFVNPWLPDKQSFWTD